MGRTQHVLLCTLWMCIAALLPSLAFADERPSDKPNTVFLPLTLQSHVTPAVSSSPPPPTPTAPVTPTDPTPTPVTPTDPTPAPAAVVLTPLEAEVVQLTNEARAQYNCPALNVSPELTLAARAHSQDMADHDYFDHKGSDGSQPGDRMKAEGYMWRIAAENILAGSNDAQAIVDFWMNSDGHRANILNCGYKDIGVGFVYDPNDTYDNPVYPFQYYWTQDFGALP